MDRKAVYPGALPLETDILYPQQFAYEAFGLLMKDLIGTTTYFADLGCSPSSPAALTVQIAPGRMYTYQNLDNAALGQLAGLGGLPADTNPDHKIVKQGILRDTTTLSGFAAPVTAGQSINYLIQIAFSEADSTPIQRRFYNTQQPGVPINSDVSDFRRNTITLNVKAGSPATTGSQVTPTADAGFVPAYVVTVAYGQTTIGAGNIATHPSASQFSALASVVTRLISTAGLAAGGGDLRADRTITVPPALAADVRAGTSTAKAMTPGDTYNALAEVTLTDAATIAVDMSTFINAAVTLGGNRTLGPPTNAKPGQGGRIRIIQDGTGSRTLAFASAWKREGGPPTLSTTPGAVDYIEYDVVSASLVLYTFLKAPS